MFNMGGNTNNTTGGNMFGNTANTGNTGGGNMFGNTATTGGNTGGNMFGNTTTTGGGNMFGGGGNTSTTNTGGNMFGNTSTTGGGNMFGNTATTGGNMFGGNTTSTTGGNMFGNTSTTGGSNMFGGSNTGGNMFGGNTNTGGNMFSNMGGGQMQQQQQNPVEKRLGEIEKAYNGQSPDCRFHFIFYNKVAPNQVQQHQAPPNANRRLWEQARRNNPDPSSLVPVQIAGFDDLKKRLLQHEKASTNYSTTLKNIQGTLDKMQTDHRTHTATRIAKVRRDGIKLSHRLLKLLNKIETMRASDHPLESTEVDYRRRLDNIRRRLIKPGHFQSRVAEQTSIVNMQVDGNTDVDMSKSMEETQVRKIYEFLEFQKQGLTHVNQVLRKDMKDMQLVSKKLPPVRHTN